MFEIVTSARRLVCSMQDIFVQDSYTYKTASLFYKCGNPARKCMLKVLVLFVLYLYLFIKNMYFYRKMFAELHFFTKYLKKKWADKNILFIFVSSKTQPAV